MLLFTIQKIFLILPVSFLAITSLYAETRSIQLNDVVYILKGTNNALVQNDDLYYFHREFTSSVKKIYTRHNVRIPVKFTVYLAKGAYTFQQLTGESRYVAGVYDPLRDSFFFQDPAALKKRGIIQRIIQHEMTHQVIQKARLERGSEAKQPELYWLEESFCEARCPVTGYYSRSKKPVNKKKVSFDRFRRYLSLGLRSRSGAKRKMAYKSAGRWGSFLMKHLGERKFFETITGTGDISAVRKAYQEYRFNGTP